MTFEHTLWLYSIPAFALVLLGVFVLWQFQTKKRLSHFAAHALLPSLLESYSKIRASVKYALLGLGILTLLFTLAQPQSGYTWEERPSTGVDVIFAVDASRSMLAEDIKPNRLERSKFAVLDLLKKLGGHRVGLVAFAGDAFLQCPLTFDYDAFRQSLEAIDTRIILKGGSDLGGAIRESAQSFQSGKNKKIIVVFTDGEDLGASSLEAAQEAAQNEITIYTIGVGTPEGELIPLRAPGGGVDYIRDDKNRLVKSRLDESTLTSVAELTQGFYSRLGGTNWSLESLYEAGIEVSTDESAEKQKIPLERFQWPLALALIFLGLEPLIGRRKRSFIKKTKGIYALALLYVLLSPETMPSVSANEGNTERYNEGTRLYNEGHFKEAGEALSSALETDNLALQEKAFYNLGNARYREGQVQRGTNPNETKRLWEAAIKDYQNALELNPEDKNAAFNKDIVEKALKQLNEELDQQEQQNNPENTEDNENQEKNPEDSEQKNEQKENEKQGEENSQSSPDSQSEDQGEDNKSGEPKEEQNTEQNADDSEPQDPADSENKEEKPQDDTEPQNKNEDTSDTPDQQNERPSEDKDDTEPRDGEHKENQDELSLDPDKNPIQPQGETDQEGTPMDAEMQWDAIRKEEASRLLDSLKSEERKLPYTGGQKTLDEDGPTQDW